jgi:L-ascorbate metabolism protein UlaG (beta-lactamase superfamily)
LPLKLKWTRMKSIIVITMALATLFSPLRGQYKSDVIKTSDGDLEMFFIGHGTLMFKINQKVIHIDPVMMFADYATMPDADLVLVTHEHGDHLDVTAINNIMKENTRVVMPEKSAGQVEDMDAMVMKNGDVKTVDGIRIRAIPAYNMVNKRPNGSPFHPKGEGNGYILTFGQTNVLIGGDTENIPEYNDLDMKIDVAFLPMNLPYTMTPEMVAEAAKVIKPGILYPYHYGETDPQRLVELLKNEPGIEVRVRDLK